MNIEDRIERLNTLIKENRVIRNDWVGTDEQGRETACLLAALSPEVAEQETASACPAELMPGWMAYLTPWIDDKSSEAEWPRMVRRYAACAARWSTLDNAAWRRVEIASRRASVVEAMSHTTQDDVLDACRTVLAWLDDDMPEQSRKELRASLEAASAAATAAVAAVAATAVAATAATAAVATATVAASAVAAATVAVTAAAAVTVVAAAAAVAAWAAQAPEVVAWAVVAEAQAEAADRIIDAVLSALEKECGWEMGRE
jgi:hypothetical protein